ncbi:hypothetical protein AB7C87_23605 [Natrarchaeobius sp. A-rgal3]|uniref:hypothetical protein n=1 Tax=Natrarchaeobius versutus TaxID=1679078 RepID=UPI0035108145
MNRKYAAAVMLALLMPGVWLSEGQTIPMSVLADTPLADTPIPIDETLTVDVPTLLFAGIPALFVIFMLVSATGHIWERRPPS